MRERHFSDVAPELDFTVSVLQAKLDRLVALYDAAPPGAYTGQEKESPGEFSRLREDILASLSPLLQRLAATGSFFCKFDPDSGSPGYHRRLSFFSSSGYEVVRGFVITGTALFSVSDPPPPLDAKFLD